MRVSNLTRTGELGTCDVVDALYNNIIIVLSQCRILLPSVDAKTIKRGRAIRPLASGYNSYNLGTSIDANRWGRAVSTRRRPRPRTYPNCPVCVTKHRHSERVCPSSGLSIASARLGPPCHRQQVVLARPWTAVEGDRVGGGVRGMARRTTAWPVGESAVSDAFFGTVA